VKSVAACVCLASIALSCTARAPAIRREMVLQPICGTRSAASLDPSGSVTCSQNDVTVTENSFTDGRGMFDDAEVDRNIAEFFKERGVDDPDAQYPGLRESMRKSMQRSIVIHGRAVTNDAVILKVGPSGPWYLGTAVVLRIQQRDDGCDVDAIGMSHWSDLPHQTWLYCVTGSVAVDRHTSDGKPWIGGRFDLSGYVHFTNDPSEPNRPECAEHLRGTFRIAVDQVGDDLDPWLADDVAQATRGS
jgi:hypothetical protein